MSEMTPPADLAPDAVVVWEAAVQAARRHEPVLLRGYVDAVLRYEAVRQLYEGSASVVVRDGQVVRNPVFDTLRDAADLMRRFATDLGITRQMGLFDDSEPETWMDRGAGGRATSKFSPERAEAVLTGIRVGNSRTRAAVAAGITKDTVRRWADRYPSFARRLDQAEAEGVALLLGAVRQHAMSGAPNTWQAAAWILERTHPDEFGQRSRVDISMDIREHVKEIAAETGLDEAEIMAEAERLLTEKRATR